MVNKLCATLCSTVYSIFTVYCILYSYATLPVPSLLQPPSVSQCPPRAMDAMNAMDVMPAAADKASDDSADTPTDAAAAAAALMHIKKPSPFLANSQGAKLLAQAEAGKAFAMSMVGTFLLKGKGCERDKKTARIWFEKAAALGDAEAQSKLDAMMEEDAKVEALRAEKERENAKEAQDALDKQNKAEAGSKAPETRRDAKGRLMFRDAESGRFYRVDKRSGKTVWVVEGHEDDDYKEDTKAIRKKEMAEMYKDIPRKKDGHDDHQTLDGDDWADYNWHEPDRAGAAQRGRLSVFGGRDLPLCTSVSSHRFAGLGVGIQMYFNLILYLAALFWFMTLATFPVFVSFVLGGERFVINPEHVDALYFCYGTPANLGDSEAVAESCMWDTDDTNGTCQASLTEAKVRVMGEMFDGRDEFHWSLPPFVVTTSLVDSG